MLKEKVGFKNIFLILFKKHYHVKELNFYKNLILRRALDFLSIF